MAFAAGNAQNIGARAQQQDAFGFSDLSDRKFVAHGGFLGVVADGMGGLANGTEASLGAVRAFLAAYTRKSPEEAIPDALSRSLREANGEVLRLAANSAGDELGTTLVAAALHDGVLHWLSVGDSRIYLLHGSELIQLTTDHIYAKDLNAKAAEGRISKDEAENHPERASLTSYLGQAEPKEVDQNRHPLAIAAEDCVVLCSDGLYRSLSEEEIVAAFQEGLQPACDALVAKVLAKRRRQQDNLTIIALKELPKSKGGFGNPGGARPLTVLLAMLIVCVLSAGAGYWYGQSLPENKAPAPAEDIVSKPSRDLGGEKPTSRQPVSKPAQDQSKVPAGASREKPPAPLAPKNKSAGAPASTQEKSPGGGAATPSAPKAPPTNESAPANSDQDAAPATDTQPGAPGQNGNPQPQRNDMASPDKSPNNKDKNSGPPSGPPPSPPARANPGANPGTQNPNQGSGSAQGGGLPWSSEAPS